MPSQTTLFYLETLKFYHKAQANFFSNEEVVLRTVAHVLSDPAVFGSDFDEAAAKEAITILNEPND